MSKSSEYAMSQDNDDLGECQMAEEEQAYYKTVGDVADFIKSGAATFEQVAEDIRREVSNAK